MGFSIINHPFWGIPIYGTPHIYLLQSRIFDDISMKSGFAQQASMLSTSCPSIVREATSRANDTVGAKTYCPPLRGSGCLAGSGTATSKAWKLLGSQGPLGIAMKNGGWTLVNLQTMVVLYGLTWLNYQKCWLNEEKRWFHHCNAGFHLIKMETEDKHKDSSKRNWLNHGIYPGKVRLSQSGTGNHLRTLANKIEAQLVVNFKLTLFFKQTWDEWLVEITSI